MGRILDNPVFSGQIQFTSGTFTAAGGTTVDLSNSTVKLPAGALAGVTLPLMVGDGAGAGGTAGAVPAPPAGSAAGGMFLNAYGQWSVPAANLPAGTALVLSPMTTALDMIVGGANGAATRLAAPAAGTAGTMVLQWTSAAGIVWAAQAAAGGGGISEAPQDGILYGREDGAWTQIPVGGNAGSSTLAGLSDVDETTAPTNGQVLVFSASDGGGKWKPGTVAAAVGSGGVSAPSSATVVQSILASSLNPLAFTSPVQSGNVVIVSVGSEASLGGLAISDTLGNAYTLGALQAGATNAAIYYAVSRATGANTVTIAGASNPYSFLGLAEVSGLDVNTPVNVSGTGGGSSPVTVPLNTTAANTFCFVACQGFHDASVFSAASGTTILQSATNNDAFAFGYLSAVSAGAVTPSFNLTDPDNSSAVAVAFNVSAAAPSTAGKGGPALAFVQLVDPLLLPAVTLGTWQDIPGLSVAVSNVGSGNTVMLSGSVCLSSTVSGTMLTLQIVRADGTVFAVASSSGGGGVPSQTGTYWNQSDYHQETQVAWVVYDTPASAVTGYKVQVQAPYSTGSPQICINRGGGDRPGVDSRGVSTLSALVF